MLDLTHYLIANPMVAAGLGILALLVLHNLRRGQPRVAIGMALLIFVAVFYISRQVLTVTEVPPGLDGDVMQDMNPPEPPE